MHPSRGMKRFLSFLSYHNAVPAALVVLALGAGGAFAAEGVFSDGGKVDASALLSADLDSFDFHTMVTGVVETDDSYTVSYSLQTLAPQGSAWESFTKTGEFTVAKDALGESGFPGYVAGKLRDIENGERAYLARARELEKELAYSRSARPASRFASLVGLALDDIPVPVVEKPAYVPPPEAPAVAIPAVTNEPAEEPESGAPDSGTATTSPAQQGTGASATTTPSGDAPAPEAGDPEAEQESVEVSTSTPAVVEDEERSLPVPEADESDSNAVAATTAAPAATSTPASAE